MDRDQQSRRKKAGAASHAVYRPKRQPAQQPRQAVPAWAAAWASKSPPPPPPAADRNSPANRPPDRLKTRRGGRQRMPAARHNSRQGMAEHSSLAGSQLRNRRTAPVTGVHRLPAVTPPRIAATRKVPGTAPVR